MLSLRRHSISRTLFRRQVLALIVSTSPCLSVLAEDSDTTSMSAQSSTTLKIRSATKTWSDESQSIEYQPTMRFRGDNTGRPKTGQSRTAPDPTGQAAGALRTPPLLDSRATLVVATESDEWMTNDNWVARDAVNLKQPLRDPQAPAIKIVPREPAPVLELAPSTVKREPAELPTLATPKLTTPKLATPKLGTPTLSAPTLSAPAQTTPTLAAPHQSTTPDPAFSATLRPPKMSAVHPADSGQSVGDLEHDSLRLVRPSEVNQLRSIDTARLDRATSVAGEPALADVVDTPVELDAEPSTQTAIDSMLSVLSDEPSLNSPTATPSTEMLSPETLSPETLSIETPSIDELGDSLEWDASDTEFADMQPSDTELEDTEFAESELGDMESDPALADLDSELGSLTAPSNQDDDLDTAPEGIHYRRLKINRDGSPADTTSSLSSSTIKMKQPNAEETYSLHASDEDLRDAQADNEPLHNDSDFAIAESDEESKPQLEVVPIAQPRLVESALPLGPLDYTGRPTNGLMRVTGAVQRLQPMMRSCLSYYHGTPEEAVGRSNWGMMHQIMVYGVDTNIIAGRSTHNAIAWIAGNNACRGQRILTTGARGIQAKSGVGLQGHQGQLLAVLSLSEVPESYPLYAGPHRFQVRDLVLEEMAICKSGEELTFTLIGLSHYLDTDQQWRSADGQTWDFERLIREELSQPIVGAACGGTHRLMGFAHALRKRRAEGKEISGQWLRAENFLNEFVTYTYQLQNRDGSMSTNWFEGREDNGNLDRKVQTTGHMVEWLLTYTADEDLQNPRLVAAIQFLLHAMNSDRKHDWQIGPKGHALRSLAMYYDRVYQNGRAWSGSSSMARSHSHSRR